MPDRQEILEEFKTVFSGKNTILDSVIPPLLFLVINAVLGFQTAMWFALVCGAAITLARVVRKEKILYALGGIGAALLAIGLRYLLNSTTAFFLPTLINGGLTTLVLLVSILIKRPAVAFTSHITRRWPLHWYWHDQVRPAYSEVTAVWVVFSAVKLLIQFWLFSREDVNSLALFNVISGWPTLILLLIFSYVYGLQRLRHLKGPSVEEFNQNAPPPWQGQQRGF